MAGNDVTKDQFVKSLSRLENLAKAQTPNVAKGQLFHTAGDSEPSTTDGWSGSTPQEQETMRVPYAWENGTDYNGHEGVKKALAEKVSKSQALTPAEVAIVKGENPLPIIGQKLAKGENPTPAEQWALKSGFKGLTKSEEGHKAKAPGENSPSQAPETHAGNDDEEAWQPQANAHVGKSLSGAIEGTKHLEPGINMSPVLAEFAKAMAIALEGTEARLIKAVNSLNQRIGNVEKVVSSTGSDQGEFNKSFAEAIVGIGQQVAAVASLADQVASAPVGAPKSQLRALPGGNGVTPLQKSFGPGGLDFGEGAIAKAQITGALVKMVEAKQLNPRDVIKWESTGEMSAQTQAAVQAFIQSGNRQAAGKKERR